MAWKVSVTPKALNTLKRLVRNDTKRIFKFLDEHLQNRDNQRQIGESLQGNLDEFWR
ncbi:MAG: hypothetical protein K6G15_11910 [Desulfovibrio sp.]|nr:hypothetical protein [Desulfovibrio sp.]